MRTKDLRPPVCISPRSDSLTWGPGNPCNPWNSIVHSQYWSYNLNRCLQQLMSNCTHHGPRRPRKARWTRWTGQAWLGNHLNLNNIKITVGPKVEGVWSVPSFKASTFYSKWERRTPTRLSSILHSPFSPFCPSTPWSTDNNNMKQLFIILLILCIDRCVAVKDLQRAQRAPSLPSLLSHQGDLFHPCRPSAPARRQ